MNIGIQRTTNIFQARNYPTTEKEKINNILPISSLGNLYQLNLKFPPTGKINRTRSMCLHLRLRLTNLHQKL